MIVQRFAQRPALAGWLAPLLALATGITACASGPGAGSGTRAGSPAAPVQPVAVVVQSIPTPRVGPELTPEKKARADQAATAGAELLATTERECGAAWLGDAACNKERFLALAADYQAYYAYEKDPAQDTSRIDSLPRLGGLGVTADELATRVSGFCEERCRAARMAGVGAASQEAGVACGRARKGYVACDALGKRVAQTLPQREADLAAGRCEGTCDDVRQRAADDAKRPRTKAQEAACETKCRRDDPGGWCGTNLMTCLMYCQPPEPASAP